MEEVIKVRMSKDLAEHLFTRDDKGNKLTVEWGEPDEEGFYNPIIHIDYDDNILLLRDMIPEK